MIHAAIRLTRTGRPRRRTGSALVLVLVMTLSMAGLAVSAVLLSSSSALVQRYYDKDRDYRLMARAAIGRTKATVQRDTTLTIPSDTAYRAMTAQALTDASGTTIGTIRVNSYAAYTGDTAGTYIPFLTIMAQAYDTLGTRSVQRLDLQSEAFSRYAIFVDTFLPNTVLDSLAYVRGRVHGNRNWVSAVSTYYDTLSLSGTAHSGSATYSGNGVAVTNAKRIMWPTSTSLSNLPTLASAGGLSFSQLTASSASSVNSGGGVDISGDATAASFARRGTRLRFRPVDVNGNGAYDASEGFFMIFDLASGMDTSNFRTDIANANSETTRPTNCHVTSPSAIAACRSTILLNQCGLMVTISGRKEFFPVVRFREQWVRQRVMLSTAPVVSSADTTIMRSTYGSPEEADTTSVKKILSYGYGYSRCFPAGSPYLMLSERYVTSACAIDSTTGSNYPYAWGGPSGCTSQRYGGQDTTFTVNVRRCYIRGSSGQCYDAGTSDGLQRLGNWRAFGGTSSVPALTTIQDAERAYLWPISTTYNAASRGVIYASNTSALFVSDTVRGFVTLYAHGRVVLLNDVVYDKDPTDPNALCRNMLGIIADTSIKVANSPLNFPRRLPGGPSTSTSATNFVFLGSPNFNLHGYMLALSTTTSTFSRLAHGTVTVEDSSSNGVGGLTCKGISTSGGCWFHTGGAAMKVFHESMAAAGTGLLKITSPDPCQDQKTNRRPPFFPLTGRYLDYKWSEVDTRDADTWAEIKTYLSRLRGNNRAVP